VNFSCEILHPNLPLRSTGELEEEGQLSELAASKDDKTPCFVIWNRAGSKAGPPLDRAGTWNVSLFQSGARKPKLERDLLSFQLHAIDIYLELL